MHPEYKDIGVKYHVTFDHYALSEIAVWKTVERMLPPKLLQPEVPAEILNTCLVEHAMNLVSQRMGTDFRNVIIACLEFHDIHGSERERSSFVRKLQQEILEKLQQASLP